MVVENRECRRVTEPWLNANNGAVTMCKKRIRKYNCCNNDEGKNAFDLLIVFIKSTFNKDIRCGDILCVGLYGTLLNL